MYVHNKQGRKKRPCFLGDCILPLDALAFAAELSRGGEGGERRRWSGDQQSLHVVQLGPLPPVSHNHLRYTAHPVRLFVPATLKELFSGSLPLPTGLWWSRLQTTRFCCRRCFSLYYLTTSSYCERPPAEHGFMSRSKRGKSPLTFQKAELPFLAFCCSTADRRFYEFNFRASYVVGVARCAPISSPLRLRENSMAAVLRRGVLSSQRFFRLVSPSEYSILLLLCYIVDQSLFSR